MTGMNLKKKKNQSIALNIIIKRNWAFSGLYFKTTFES